MAARQDAAGVATGGQSQTPLIENKSTTTTNNDGDESDDGVPYDRGWAWMVVAGCFINALVLAGYLKSSGVYFVRLLQYFQASTSRTAVLFGVRGGVISIVGNLPERPVATRGASSLFLHVFATGVGLSFLSAPGDVLTGSYFRQRRALALALVKCGVSVGSMVVPQLLTWMLREYGLHGTLLLTGENEEALLAAEVNLDNKEKQKERKELFRSLSSGSDSNAANGVRSQNVSISLPTQKGFLSTAVEEQSILSPARSTSSRLLDKLETLKWWPAQLSVSTLDLGSTTMIDTARASRSPNTPSVSHPSHTCRTCGHSKVGLQASKDRIWTCCLRVLKTPFVLLDFSLFRRPSFRLLLLYASLNSFPAIFLDYLPAVATSNGIGEAQVAMLITIVGGLDFVCRLGGGIAAHTGKVRVSRMIALSFVMLGITCQFVRFMASFTHFVTLAVIYGLLGGLSYALNAVLIIEYVGLEKMSQGYSFFQFVSGACSAAWYPLLGYIRDSMGSYTPVYHVLGCTFLLSAAILTCEGMVQRYEKRANVSRDVLDKCRVITVQRVTDGDECCCHDHAIVSPLNASRASECS
ncbi:hypothetical protein C0Q70_05487 [Pomacea canaliculata]|uniref:Major facilitator superfamily (MFS) profile domain-containing protein n=1 Tax=Pomacea canaliculata TaxID=400727 RepID=A0A2T7PLB3_POMCA|nr:hypothetical protein C0Q70_05487 [Pomacea canaliculata]